jgi:hypothetical protein
MIEPAPDGIVLSVRVIPRAAKPGLAGTRAGSLLVRVTAPPIEGAANAEVIEVIAGALGVPRRRVSIVSGARSRQKRVHVAGLDVGAAADRVAARSG